MLNKPKVANPNQKKVIKIERNQSAPKLQKQWLPSDRKLKVTNFDEKSVTNEDLRKLFEEIGPIKLCRFDRDNFDQFLGSATVTYEKPEDAARAIREYNGAYLDSKVL